MAPISASKAKRLAEKAAKSAAKGESVSSKTGSKASTPLTSSANASTDDLSMAKLRLATDRSGSGVLASDPQSRDIHIESYSLSFHGRLLIENAEFSLNYGQRYGLLGENGSGKTTFLESMANRDVEIPEHIDIYLVRGEAEPSEQTALDFIVQSAKDKAARLEAQIEEMSVADNVDELALEAKYEELEELDPSTFESKAGAILAGLGFGPEMMKKATKDMSGGWRMRVSLAKALTIRPHLLLLDEPTNHLDLEAVVWLEAYLATYNHILVLTSHSQDFMDSVCTNILDLTLDRKFLTYGGDYSTYVRTKTENEVNQMKAYQKQQDEIKHIKDFIASAGTYANLVKQAKSKQKIIDKMEAAGFIKPVIKFKDLSFNFEDVKKLPPPIIAFNDVGFSYDGNMKNALYKDTSFGIDMDSRIAIVGQNGTGKSTLLNLITGALQPTQGSINRHPSLKLAKYSQHSADQLPYDKSPLEYLEVTNKAKYPDKDMQYWRSCIGRFGVSGSHQTSPISHLSDGLRNRVVFAQLALERPDILLLDEPTNHLDMGSIDALAKAIKEFTGGVVIVSHDFRLISQVAEQLWEVKEKKVTDLSKSDISIVEYKKILSKNSQAQIEKARLVSLWTALVVPHGEEKQMLRRVPGPIDLASFMLGSIELAERLSYYGCTVVFTNFIQRGLPEGSTTGAYSGDQRAGALGMGQQASTGLTTFNQFFVYTVPLFGAYIADSYLGRYKTICWSVLVAFIGHVLLVGSAAPTVIAHPNGAIGFFAVSIIIMGIGTGGFKSNIGPIVADGRLAQALHVRQRRRPRRPDRHGLRREEPRFWLAFLLPTIVFATTPVVLWLGRHRYVRTPPTGSTLGKAFRTLGVCFKGRWFSPRKWY
ncbi:hypothetical protein JCM6882_009497, partial [Rhodosporidiobolus microsporus]